MELEDYKCPKCNNPIIIDENSEMINCNNCKNEYIYKFCADCSKIIFFEKMFSDGYNIQCPYISCGSTHSCIKCPNKGCTKLIIYKNKYSQGDKLRCSNCKICFKKVKCPCEGCPNNIVKDLNYLEGSPIECQHKDNKFIFQKVCCWYCGRHSVWDNSKGKYYIEGQMIICPYKECERMTNKITCPKCLNSSVITRGNLDMGKKINCSIKGCENVYNIYFCPYCKKTNYGNGSSIVAKNLICNYCKESFCFVNCCFCKQINFWKKPYNYFPCQTIICTNEGCRKKSALIPCPVCKKINYFSKGVFVLGQKYACSYRDCKNEFVILFCSHCNFAQIKQANLDPKILYTCDKCKNYMPTVQCPKCLKFCCLENNNKIETHTIFKCPYEDCEKIFYYYKCPFCNHDFNSCKYINNNIKCPFLNCNKIFTYFKCNKCTKDNYIENNDNTNMECEEINCLYCNEKNDIDKPNNDNYIKLKDVKIMQGEKYIFDNPEEDPYDRKIINSLIKINMYDISFTEENAKNEIKSNHNKMCVICLSNEIEWILVPCGHKCVCNKCGKIAKEKYVKCPICKQKIIGVLQKVIDD